MTSNKNNPIFRHNAFIKGNSEDKRTDKHDNILVRCCSLINRIGIKMFIAVVETFEKFCS